MWDGDVIKLEVFAMVEVKVPSPPCGMVTFSQIFYYILFAFQSSEPTVWDGDTVHVFSRVAFLLVPSPPCGMVTPPLAGFLNCLKLVPSPPCGMVTGNQGGIFFGLASPWF